MDGIKPRHLLLNNAHKLTAVECPNNTELINIQIDNCSYLQRLNLQGCSSLGNLTSSQVLIVDGCNNLSGNKKVFIFDNMSEMISWATL